MFEKYIAKRGKGGAYVTLRKNSIAFFKDFLTANDLEKTKTVDLFYDKTKNLIGVKFLPNAKGQLKLTHSKGPAFVNATRFFRQNEMDPLGFERKYLPQPLEHEEFGKLFIIPLKEKAWKVASKNKQ